MNGSGEEARGFGETQVIPAAQGIDELVAAFFDPMKLHYRGAGGATAAIELSGKFRFTIGRDASSDIVFADPRISRVHASIELVEGHHLLRDNRSSNGTFLNGLRASPANAFALREGDVIEIGSERIVFTRASECVEPAPAAIAAEEPREYDLAALRREEHAALDAGVSAQIQAAIQRTFAGQTEARGLQRVLALVLDRLDAHAAAAFTIDAGGALRPVAAVPSPESSATLVGLARSAVQDGKGHLATGPSPHDGRGGGARTQGASSCAAAPIARGERRRGVLAVERLGGESLGRAELAILATIGEWIEAVLEHMESTAGNDTRYDFAD